MCHAHCSEQCLMKWNWGFQTYSNPWVNIWQHHFISDSRACVVFIINKTVGSSYRRWRNVRWWPFHFSLYPSQLHLISIFRVSKEAHSLHVCKSPNLPEHLRTVNRTGCWRLLACWEKTHRSLPLGNLNPYFSGYCLCEQFIVVFHYWHHCSSLMLRRPLAFLHLSLKS